MKLQEQIQNCEEELYSSDLLNDIFEGYLKPEEILENEEDIQRVKNAIEVLENFKSLISQFIGEM